MEYPHLRQLLGLLLWIFFLVTPSAPEAGASAWVEEQQDPALWARIRDVLHAELRPDDPAKRAPHQYPYGYKYLARVARMGDVCLILLGERDSKNSWPRLDRFVAFSLDLATGAKTFLDSFLRWEFLRWARFGSATVPDAVFRYDDCVECEQQSYLSSFFYGASRREWNLRAWPEDGTGLLIGGARREGVFEDGTVDDITPTCLFGIGAYTKGRASEIAIWCRHAGMVTKRTREGIVLYAVSPHGPEKRKPDPALARVIERQLCRQSPTSPLCRASRSSLRTGQR